MPMYHIDIDGREYEGFYGSPADAVFGAMLKDSYDEESPHWTVAREQEYVGRLVGVQRIDKKGRWKARRVG